MYIFITDETNISHNNDPAIKFFVYGGLIIPLDKASLISEQIKIIRKNNGYISTDKLKFNISSKPSSVSSKQFTQVKNDIINLCLENDCKFLVYVVLHKIAENQGINKTIKWGADHIMGKFNYFLEKNNSKGLVVVDRFSDTNEYSFLSEKFTKGLIFKDKNVELKNILLFSSSCDNASNLSSAVDITLGSFRYCINQLDNKEPAKTMAKNIAKILWADKLDNDNIDPFEKGFTLRPKMSEIKNPSYKKEYDDLIKQINFLLE